MTNKFEQRKVPETLKHFATRFRRVYGGRA